MPPEDNQAAPAAQNNTPPETQTPGAQSSQPPEADTHSLLRLFAEKGIIDSDKPDDGDPDGDDPDGDPEKKTPAAAPADGADPDKPKGSETPEPQSIPEGGEKPKPVRVRTQKVARPELPIEPEKPATTEPQAVAAPSKPDPKWEAALESNEKQMLEEAREYEKRLPEKHKGLTTRVETFLRKHQEMVDKAGADFDDQDPEYRSFVEKNQPRLSPEDIREIESLRIADRVRGEYEPKFNELKQELFVRDEEPKIEREGMGLYAEMEKAAVPKEILEAIGKDGFEKASKRYRLEIETAQAVLTAATEDFKELIRLGRVNPTTSRALSEEATDRSSPKFEQHERLRQLVRDVCDDFRKTAPTTEQYKNGKWFVTREELSRIPAAKRGEYWTFANRDIIARAKPAIKATLDKAIEMKRGYIEGYGFRRDIPNGAAPSAPPTATPRIPAGAPVPSPGSDGASGDSGAMGKQLLSAWNRPEPTQ